MLNIAIIGLGGRGRATLQRLGDIPSAHVVALCEKDPAIIPASTLAEASTIPFTTDWHDILMRDDVDLVYICTPWETHVEMAVETMKAGKHVALEVPAAMSVSECELLVRVASWTSRHCVMLENCCYDTWHLGIREMVRQGILGEITHLEGAYIHPVDGEWMKHQRLEHKGNPYPTHGLGPMCQLLDSDDRLDYLVSFSTSDRNVGFHLNDTLIRTRKGVTLLLQYDTTTPRPYNRLQTVCGTKGFAQKYPLPTLVINGQDGEQTTLTGSDAEAKVESFITPEFRLLLDEGKRLGVKNVMNYMMDRRLIDALICEKEQNANVAGHHDSLLLPLDIEVHEAALWSSITELSERSAQHGGERVSIPDF